MEDTRRDLGDGREEVDVYFQNRDQYYRLLLLHVIDKAKVLDGANESFNRLHNVATLDTEFDEAGNASDVEAAAGGAGYLRDAPV